MAAIDYTKVDQKVREAYFEYARKMNGNTTVCSFVAGYNAAEAEHQKNLDVILIEVRKLKQMMIERGIY